MNRPLRVIDLYAGAGGTSTGCARACKELGLTIRLTAINHWPVAVESHKKNHPWAEHLCISIEAVDPRTVVEDGNVDLLVASPECTHFSNARGGRPTNDQLRASSWNILRWLELLDVKAILIENVPEYRNWGPIGPDGKPIKERKGETFQAFINGIKSFGYSVEYRILNAADYGEATARKRLFVIARKDGQPIVWPTPTHSKDGKVAGTLKWRAAREVLDLTLPNQSIFGRKRPLSPKTMRKIAVGALKFWGIDLTRGGELDLSKLRPFIVPTDGPGGNGYGNPPRSLDDPLNTIRATRGAGHVAQPFVLGQQGGAEPRSIDDPLPTVAGAGFIRVAEPFIMSTGTRQSTNPPRSADQPLPTVMPNHRMNVVEPLILTTDRPETNRSLARPTDDPLPTVTGNIRIGVVEPFLIANFGERNGQEPRVHDTKQPVPTITSRGAGTLIEPVLIEYYGNGQVRPVDGPLPTQPTHDRFGLAIPLTDGRYLDIRFRMLQPKELQAAMGFEAHYAFTGTRTQVVKQIGNAVGVNMAKALCETVIVQTRAV
jgi:DNA (cytosine-5)-methyltransferase 1